MKCTEEGRKLSKENPFKIDRDIKTIVGKKLYYEIKPLSSGLLLIEVDQKQTHDKMMQIRKVHDIPVSVSPHSFMNSSKGTIFCDSISRMTNEEIKEELKDQDVTDVYRIQKRDGELTPLYILTFSVPTLPKTVKLGYMNCRVRLYIPKPRRCFNCQGYGHGKNTCTHEPVCAKCAETGSEHPSFDDCRNDPKCYHCHGDHPASSKDCPMYLLEDLITERKTKNQLTHATAKEQIINENLELAKQIPKLKVNRVNKGSTYSSAAASPSALQQQKDIMAQQNQLLIRQQQKMDQMEQQISFLISLQQSQNSQYIPTLMNVSEPPSNNIKKHKRNDSTSSEETNQPTKCLVTSLRQEDKQPETQSSSSAVGETPSVSGKAASEGTKEGERWTTVGGNSPRRPLNPSTSSSAAPSAAVPSTPLAKNVKGGGKAGSSGPSEDKRSAVSRPIRPKKITGPDPKNWR